jgi:hypothetical protein
VSRCAKIINGKNCEEPVVETLRIPTPRKNVFAWLTTEGQQDGTTPVNTSDLPEFSDLDVCAKHRNIARHFYGLDEIN